MTSKNSTALNDSLRTHFVQALTPTTGWGNAVSMYQMLLGLRGLWTFSSINETDGVYDYSMQSRLLKPNNTPTFGLYGLAPYTNLVRSSSQYHDRGDEAGIDITGALTVFSWAWFDAESTGQATGVVSKWDAAIVNERSYRLDKTNTDVPRFSVSLDGTAETTVSAVASDYSAGAWRFLAGRYTPQDELAVFVGFPNGTINKYTNTTSIPASIYNSVTDLEFGRYSTSNYLDGRLSICALTAYAQPDVVVKALFHQTRSLYGAKLT